MTSHATTCTDAECPGDMGLCCPGRGKCHGCMAWCDRCGDVDDVCDSFYCMQHRCITCHNILTFRDREFNYERTNEWHRWCLDCWVKERVQRALDRDENEIDAMRNADRQVERYRSLADGEGRDV